MESVLDGQVLVEGYQIEQIAMLAGGGVGPSSGGWTDKPHIQALARRVGHIANLPIAPAAEAVGEVVPADRLGLLRKTARDVRCRARHEALVRGLRKLCESVRCRSGEFQAGKS
jgi:hypothetical protein